MKVEMMNVEMMNVEMKNVEMKNVDSRPRLFPGRRPGLGSLHCPNQGARIRNEKPSTL